MVEVAQAAVTIIPTLKGAQQTITKELTNSAEPAAEKVGKSSGTKFASKFGSAVSAGAKTIAKAVTASVATVGALSASFYKAAKATAEFGDHIDKMSQKMGISSNAYQEWDFIAQHSGTSMDSLKTAMVKLSTAATNGSDAFDALGISAEEAQSMSREELWNKTITALTGVKDETERARLAQELFGKGATEMGALLNMSADEIEAMRQQAHDLGIVMSEEDVKAAAAFQDSLQNMQQSFQGLKNRMTAEFLPGITTIMDGLTQIFSGDGEGGVAKIKEGVASISAKITEILPELVKTGGEILKSIMDAITENLPLLMPLASDIITNLATHIVTALPTLLDTGLSILTELVNGIVENGPAMMQQATVVLTNFMTSLSERLPELLTAAADMVAMLVTGIIDNAPTLVTGAIEAISNFVTGILDNLPDILSKGAEIVGALLDGIIQNAPQILEAISGSMGDIITAVSDAIATILEALTPYIPSITELVEKTVEKLPDIITAFTGLADAISSAITSIVEAIAPYIPDITQMVETTVSKIPEIIDAFSDLLAKIGPIIDSIGDAIAKIGTALSDVVTSLGGSIATVVDSFSGLLTSLEGPITAVGSLIESIGTAIGTVVEAVGNCVASINESFAKVLDSLKGVIDSIGEGAVKAGQGFSVLADAIIKLVNQTGFFDLAATLTAVASAVGSIADTGRKAGDAYGNIEKLVGAMSAMANADIGSIATELQKVGDQLYIVTLYTPTVNDLKTALDNLNKVKMTDLVSQLDNAGKKFDDSTKKGIEGFTNLQKTIADKMKAAASDVSSKLTDISSSFTSKLAAIKTSVTNDFTSIVTTITNKMQSMTSAISTEANGWKSTVEEAVKAVKGVFAGDNPWGFVDMPSLSLNWADKVKDAIKSVKDQFGGGFSWGVPELKIPIKLPRYKVDGKWEFDQEGNISHTPRIYVEWYKKAAEMGALFNEPRIIGVGDASQPELLIGEDTLYKQIRAAVGEVNGINQNLTINAPQGLDAAETARLVRNQTRQLLARMKGGL
jgi:phage-related protein